MITKLSINGFKGFEHLEIPKLSRINLLAGQNNVGKTSIIEALFLFLNRINPQVILSQFAWRGVPVIPLDPESMWAPIFYDYDLKKDISIVATFDNSKEIMTIKYNPNYIQASIPAMNSQDSLAPIQNIRTDQKPLPSQSLDIYYDSKKMRDQKIHFLLRVDGTQVFIENALLDQRPCTFLAARAPMNSSEDAQKFGKLDIQGKQEKIVEILKIIEPKLKSLSSISMGTISLIHGDIGLARKIPVSYMGDGVSKLLSIILAIATSINGVVLIDEIENGIHYSVMPKVWEAIAVAADEYKCQIIGTSHSYECLKSACDGIPNSLKDEFTYIRIDKTNNLTKSKIFDMETLKIAMDSNMEVR